MESKTRQKRKRKKRVEEISQDKREKIREAERRKIMKENWKKRARVVVILITHFKVGGGSVFGREVRKSGTSKVLVIFVVVVARIGGGSGPFYIRKTKGVI